MDWYKHYMGDYAKKTAHLTALQHGIYRMLIDHYYALEKPLPRDHDSLYRIVRAFSKTERDAVDFVIESFFEKDGCGYRKERIDKEIAKYANRSAINKRNAQRNPSEPLFEDDSNTRYQKPETRDQTSRSQDPDSRVKHNGKSKPHSQDINQVFESWQILCNHPDAKLDDKRKKTIRTALKMGYTVDQLIQAVHGIAITPHNMGENINGQVYNGIQIIFKNADQIDRFIGNFKNPPAPKTKAEQRLHQNLKSSKEAMDRLKAEEDANADT